MRKPQSNEGTIIVFAKVPTPGSSKTRLSGLMGREGSARFASAMLSDILFCLSDEERLSTHTKVLVYAPGTSYGESQMINILAGLGLTYTNIENYDSSMQWILLPMISSTVPSPSVPHFSEESIPTEEKGGMNNRLFELNSTDLGSKLSDALERIRKVCDISPVAFLGMDSPELLVDEMIEAMAVASKQMGKAYMNPAHDGGYCFLCLPSHAPLSVFHGIRWSNSLTAISQMKGLSDNGIDTLVGSLMNDIDEPDDVMNLAIRLCLLHSKGTKAIEITDPNQDRLSHESEFLQAAKSPIDVRNHVMCLHTFEALIELGLVERKEGKNKTTYTPVLSQWDHTAIEMNFKL